MTQPLSQNIRFMTWIVIILGVLIVAALGALIFGIMRPLAEDASPGQGTVILPALEGREILETSTGEGTMTLRLTTPEGDQEIWIVDTRTGAVTSRMLLPANP